MSGSRWRAVQNTDQTFTKVCIDSGAGESVCPIGAFPSYAMHQTAKTGIRYTAAGGQELINAGEKRPHSKCGDVDAHMVFQCTNVLKPLASAAKICQKGNEILMRADGGYIRNLKTGGKIPITLKKGVFMMGITEVKPAAPFQGQAKS